MFTVTTNTPENRDSSSETETESHLRKVSDEWTEEDFRPLSEFKKPGLEQREPQITVNRSETHKPTEEVEGHDNNITEIIKLVAHKPTHTVQPEIYSGGDN